jgi:hypothetical protein
MGSQQMSLMSHKLPHESCGLRLPANMPLEIMAAIDLLQPKRTMLAMLGGGCSMQSWRVGVLRGLMILFVIFTPTVFSRAQIPGIFDPAKDVKDIISQFGAQMSALIAQAGGEARVSLVTGFQLSDSLVNSLKTAYGDSVNVTFGSLDKQQQKAFIDASKLIDELSKQVQNPIQAGLQNWTNSNEIIADGIGLLTKKPLVTAYGPKYISPASIADTINIRAAGVRLHADAVPDPKLVIGNREFQPDEVTDVSVSFVVPRTVFSDLQSGTSFKEATLKFYRDGGGWIRWPWTKTEEIPFRLLFTVLPENLGTYSATNIVR